MNRNAPIVHTQQRLNGRYATWSLGYRNNLDADWIMGISLGFKSFEYREGEAQGQELSFMSVNHESLYVLRLYHPAYLLLGTKILYMIPVQRSAFPLQREPRFETEIGAGLTLNIVYHLKPGWMLQARIDRWRGTRTDKFHALESAFGFSYGLGSAER